jgi:8-oxo-dGTP diphosphatase
MSEECFEVIEGMKHIEVVAALIVHEEEILCMQRGESRYDYLTGKYEFPGGKIEPGETRTKALMRELNEEMEIHVDIVEDDYFMTVHHIYPDFELTMCCFLCRVKSKDFTRKEHIDHQWLLPTEISALDWAMADKPIVDRISSTGIKPWR